MWSGAAREDTNRAGHSLEGREGREGIYIVRLSLKAHLDFHTVSLVFVPHVTERDTTVPVQPTLIPASVPSRKNKARPTWLTLPTSIPTPTMTTIPCYRPSSGACCASIPQQGTLSHPTLSLGTADLTRFPRPLFRYTPGGGKHWNWLAENAPRFADMGITALWIPPPTKAAGAESTGYDM